ncbi:MAG: TonB-dependent receptor [Puniceicoccales bacterium]|jgi:vitamin B12 transporter|nr:TonB-dependent receptor [Puniceicoccales bacterium]
MKHDTTPRRRKNCAIAKTNSGHRSLARQTFCAAAAIAAPFLGAGTLSAADIVPDKPAVTHLDPIVVVATRVPEALSTVSPSVNFIDASQLAPAGNYTLDNVLREQPGFYALSGSTGNVASVFTRGAESRMTLITLDGRRLNPGLSNFDTSVFSTDNLASIQAMRGATSTLHGANALGGIIDLRSVDPFENEGVSGGISGEVGSFDYRRGAFDYVSASPLTKQGGGRLGVSVGGSWSETDNNRPNSHLRTTSLLPRFDYKVNDALTFNVLTRYHDYETGLPGDNTVPEGHDALSNANGTNVLISPGFKLKIGENFSLQTYYSFTRNEYESNTRYYSTWPAPAWTPLSYDKNTVDGHEFTLIANWKITDIVAIGGGFTFEEKSYDSVANHYHESMNSASPWLRVSVTPIKNLNLSLGVRHDEFSDYKSATTGEANVSYRIDATGTTFHARIANAYSTPDIATIAYDLSYGYGAPAHFETNSLKPEKNTAWEIGIKQQVNVLDGINFGAVFFDNDFTDLIQWDYANHVGYNINKARSQGIELNADVRLFSSLRLYGNATFLKTENKQTGARLLRRPDFAATLGVEHTPSEKLTVGFSATYVHGVEDVDAATYATVDNKDYTYARLYARYLITKNVEVFGRIENLFDQTYWVVNGYPSLPVSAYVGVRFRL